MRTTIKIVMVAAIAATADVSVAAAAGPATLAGSAASLQIDSYVEKVRRRVVRRPVVRGGRHLARPYNRGGRRFARGYYPGPRFYPYYGYGGYYDGGAAVAAGIIGLALGATLGAAANNSYYGAPGAYDGYGDRAAPPGPTLAPLPGPGCYEGAGNRIECPPY